MPKSSDPNTSVEALQAKVNHLNTLLNSIGAFIYTKDLEGRYTYANQPTLDLFGKDLPAIYGCVDRDFFKQYTPEEEFREEMHALSQGQTIEKEYTSTLKNADDVHTYLVIKKPLVDKDGIMTGYCGISTDISEIHRLKQKLLQQSITDELTGLYNRRYFFEVLKKELNRTKRHQLECSLLLLDIDLFKRINDQHGHPSGDSILQQIAQTLKYDIRQEDTLARLGGEEFVILLPETSQVKAYDVAERIRIRVAESNMTGTLNTPIDVTVSIGLATSISGDADAYQLYSLADSRLYQAKDSGRNQVCQHGPD